MESFKTKLEEFKGYGYINGYAAVLSNVDFTVSLVCPTKEQLVKAWKRIASIDLDESKIQSVKISGSNH